MSGVMLPVKRRESCSRCLIFRHKVFFLLLVVYSLINLITLYYWMFVTTIGKKKESEKGGQHQDHEDVVMMMMKDQNDDIVTFENSTEILSFLNEVSERKEVRELYPGDLNDAYLKKVLSRAEKLQSNCPMQRSTGTAAASESNNESSTFLLQPFQIIDTIRNQRHPKESENYNVTCPYPPTQQQFCHHERSNNNKKQQLHQKISVLIDFHSTKTDDVVSSLRNLFYHLLLLAQSNLVGQIILQTSKDSLSMFLADKKYGKRIISWHQNKNHKLTLLVFHQNDTNSNILNNPSLQSTPKYDCICWLVIDSKQNKIMTNDPNDDNLLWKLKTGFALWKLDPSIITHPYNYENNHDNIKSLNQSNHPSFSCPNQSTIHSWQQITITQQSTPMLLFHRNYLCFLRHDTVIQNISHIISSQQYSHNVNVALFQFVLTQINGAKPVQMTKSINKSKSKHTNITRHILPQKYSDIDSLVIRDVMFYFGGVPTGYTHFCDFMHQKNTTIDKNESKTTNEGHQLEVGVGCLTSMESDHLNKLYRFFCGKGNSS